MRKLVLAIIVLLSVIFLITRFTEVQHLAQILQHGRPVYLFSALIVEIIWMANLALLFKSLYSMLGLKEKNLRLFQLASAANFISVIAPSGGMSGLAVFVTDGRKRGLPVARITIVGMMYVLLDFLGLLSIVVIGLTILWLRSNLLWSETLASLILFAAAMCLFVLLVLAAIAPERLADVLTAATRLINRILRPVLHREYLSQERSRLFAHDIAEGIQTLRFNPKALFMPALHTLLSKCLAIVILGLMFLAFRQTLSISTVLAGFSIGNLFVVVSPTPSGVGIVEGMLTIALTSLNVPVEAATIIALAFRGITFWIPLFVGMISLRAIGGLEQNSQRL